MLLRLEAILKYHEDLGISKANWQFILNNTAVATDQVLEVLNTLLQSPGYKLSASNVAKALNIENYQSVVNTMVNFSKKTAIKLKLNKLPIREDGTTRWWNIPFTGIEHEDGKFPWILRPELADALVEKFGSSCDMVLPDEEIIVTNTMPEGATKQVLVNQFERNPHARRACLRQYGYKCIICDFDFEKTYGIAGKQKIHVHHIVPLSSLKKEYSVDPIKDLRPVCPNCHFIIHSKQGDPYSIEEVKSMIEGAIQGGF